MHKKKSNRNKHAFPTGKTLCRILAACFAFLFYFSFSSVPVPYSWDVTTRPAGAEELAKNQETSKAKTNKSDPSITVYVTSWCPACAMAISYLKKKKIPFTVKDIEKNPDYMKEMVGKVGGYRGVPVLDINGKTYLGFHPSIVDQVAK